MLIRTFLVVALCALAVPTRSQNPSPSSAETSQPQQSKPPQPKSPTSADQRGTEQLPIVVKVIPSIKTDEESSQEVEGRKEKAAEDNALVSYSGILDVLTAILVGVGALQLFVFGYQALQLRRTVRAMEVQSEDMRASIAEASRAANAMESMSGSLIINAEKIVEVVEINKQIGIDQRGFWLRQMRAYLSVVIGVAIYQEKDKGIRFEARPIIRNNGNTPAYNVRYRAAAAVLPIAIPNHFKFHIPKKWGGGSIIGPHSGVEGYAVVEDYVPDEDVMSIKTSDGECLHVWGVVTYRDISKKVRRVTFAHRLFWVGPEGKETVRGFYLDTHNRSN